MASRCYGGALSLTPNRLEATKLVKEEVPYQKQKKQYKRKRRKHQEKVIALELYDP
jgi:hypothetical protein